MDKSLPIEKSKVRPLRAKSSRGEAGRDPACGDGGEASTV